MTQTRFSLEERIVSCEACPRLRDFLEECREKHPTYWGRPVHGFGDPEASLYILGLAPGYHGANRWGRVFTGDDSGRWLYGALHELGLASAPRSEHRDDGLQLSGVWIGNAVRCVPPENRPLGTELDRCRPYLTEELEALHNVRAVLCLGHLSHQTYLKHRGHRPSEFPFSHAAVHELPEAPHRLIASYHPSRQNTNTGRLTRDMWIHAIRTAAEQAGLQST